MWKVFVSELGVVACSLDVSSRSSGHGLGQRPILLPRTTHVSSVNSLVETKSSFPSTVVVITRVADCRSCTFSFWSVHCGIFWQFNQMDKYFSSFFAHLRSYCRFPALYSPFTSTLALSRFEQNADALTSFALYRALDLLLEGKVFDPMLVEVSLVIIFDTRSEAAWHGDNAVQTKQADSEPKTMSLRTTYYLPRSNGFVFREAFGDNPIFPSNQRSGIADKHNQLSVR